MGVQPGIKLGKQSQRIGVKSQSGPRWRTSYIYLVLNWRAKIACGGLLPCFHSGRSYFHQVISTIVKTALKKIPNTDNMKAQKTVKHNERGNDGNVNKEVGRML